MRLPAWLKAKRQRLVDDTVVVTLEPDWSAFREAMGRTALASQIMVGPFTRMVHAAADMERVMAAVRAATAASWELDPVRKAGLEARYYVRGAMDPTYATPEARDAYVKNLCSQAGSPVTDFHALAAAFLRGWVEHHGQDDWPELSGVCMCGATIGPGLSCGEPYHSPMDMAIWARSGVR